MLDISGDVPTVLRPGAVSLEEIRRVIGHVELRDTGQPLADPAAMPSPGLLARHYSPRAPLTLYEGDRRA